MGDHPKRTIYSLPYDIFYNISQFTPIHSVRDCSKYFRTQLKSLHPLCLNEFHTKYFFSDNNIGKSIREEYGVESGQLLFSFKIGALFHEKTFLLANENAPFIHTLLCSCVPRLPFDFTRFSNLKNLSLGTAKIHTYEINYLSLQNIDTIELKGFDEILDLSLFPRTKNLTLVNMIATGKACDFESIKIQIEPEFLCFSHATRGKALDAKSVQFLNVKQLEMVRYYCCNCSLENVEKATFERCSDLNIENTNNSTRLELKSCSKIKCTTISNITNFIISSGSLQKITNLSNIESFVLEKCEGSCTITNYDNIRTAHVVDNDDISDVSFLSVCKFITLSLCDEIVSLPPIKANKIEICSCNNIFSALPLMGCRDIFIRLCSRIRNVAKLTKTAHVEKLRYHSTQSPYHNIEYIKPIIIDNT
jgi:hypothetical protein